MPIPTLAEISGEDIVDLIDSLEKQRKELQFLLSSLDNSNVVELNAEVINAGVINAKHVSIGSETSYETGYDPNVLRIEVETQFQVIDGQISAKVSQTDFDALGQRVSTAESTLQILPGMIESKVSQTDFNGNTMVSIINQTATNIKLSAQNIDLLGIVKVASVLNIGEFGERSFDKSIRFGGTANIYCPAYTDDVVISSEYFRVNDSYVVSLGASWGFIDFNNAQILNFRGATATFG